MRADRLLSLALLLRQRGRMSAAALAQELEVSTRTVLRDIEALSLAGVPVYAERGRHGGFALLPGFRAEFAGLTSDEALALVVAAAKGRPDVFGLGRSLRSAMAKVVDALPDADRIEAFVRSERLLADPDADLLDRRAVTEVLAAGVVDDVRRAVLAGQRLRIRYAAPGGEPQWREVEPLGLVWSQGTSYLLALRDGEDRTYRLSRVVATERTGVPSAAAASAEPVDLREAWRQRSAAFLGAGPEVVVEAQVHESVVDEVRRQAVRARLDDVVRPGWRAGEVVFAGRLQALICAWGLGPELRVSGPDWLRAQLVERTAAMAAAYAEEGSSS